MGARGPKPTPTEILKARGSWRADGRTGEPTPEVTLPPCPKWVRGAAQTHWPAIVEMLANMGVMADAHTVALGLLVNALGRYIDLEERVEKGGYTVMTDKGNEIQSPVVGAMHKAWDQVMKACREFGMTPSALTAVRAIPAKDMGKDGKKRFFNPKLVG